MRAKGAEKNFDPLKYYEFGDFLAWAFQHIFQIFEKCFNTGAGTPPNIAGPYFYI